MKILFVIHQLDYADHIAISYLSSIAKELSHSTFFCCLDSHDLNCCITQIKPDIVAYSANIFGFPAIVEAHKQAVRLHPFISIMGGPQPTFSPETFMESSMDAYCMGEGEYAFRDFLQKTEAHESFDDIENLITKNKTNAIRPLIKNLDEIPLADRDLVLSNSFLKNTPKKTFYATRGCPFQCTYCCNNYYQRLYAGKGPAVRRFSVERIIQEIEDVKSKYRMEFVKFGDDLFAMQADDWLEEFSDKYASRIGLPFNCYLRFDRIDDGLLKVLKKAGCHSVHLSVDSTSKHIRDQILKRKMKDVDIVGNLRKIREYGIHTWVNYMLAVPESTLQDDLDSIEMSKKGKVTYPAFTTTTPIKGTELYTYCAEKKIIDPLLHKSDMSGCSQKSTLSCFSEKEKNIRYNIFLLGAVIAKLPWPFHKLAILGIKHIAPNVVFKRIRQYVYEYYITKKIFILSKEGRKNENTQN